MKKKLIVIICVLSAALLLVLAGLGVLYFQEQKPEQTEPSETTTAPQTTQQPSQTTQPTQTTVDLSGWMTDENGSQYYLNEQGEPLTGWQVLDGSTYYFDENGVMCTGWVEDHYLNPDGTMAMGLTDTDDGKYYFDENGFKVTGWLEAADGTYYLNEDGHPYSGWMMTDTARLYFTEDGKMATGFLEVEGIERYFTSDGNYVPLVNPWHEVPEDYEMNLVELEGFEVDFTCRDSLAQMLIDCREAGLSCPLNSTYRSIATQTYLWNARYNNYLSEGYSEEEAKTLTWRKVAYPGTSEHHLGLAVDIIGSDAMYAWFYEHSWEYGFIVRYPEDKTDVTGIMYEPWHFRYVGLEMAQQVYESGLTLEEYLDSIRETEKSE